MKHQLKFILLLLIIVPYILPGQITATDNQDIRVLPSSNQQSEVHISINKTNSDNIILSFNTNLQNPIDPDLGQQGHCVSIDNGITWAGADNAPMGEPSFCDPSTAFDASGRGYIATLSPYNKGDGYFIQFTDDEGQNWSNAIRGVGPVPGQGIDKEMIFAVDEMQTSAYANYFYCAYTDFNDNRLVKINRSTDGGTNFSTPIALSSEWGQGTNVQTGPNGEVYVCWADYTDGYVPGDNIGFAYSSDGGSNFSSSLAFSYRGIRIPDYCNPNFNYIRINDFPSMAVDKSCGQHRGRIYIAYPEFESQGSTRSVIRVRFSDNNGTSWSNAATVNIVNGRQNWFPWIAVDDLTGLVNVAYYSFDQASGASTNTYVAYSIDGANWQNIRVSDQPHNTASIPGYYCYTGDYIGIASYQGRSWVAWADQRGNEPWQIYVSRLDYDLQMLTSSQSSLVINNPEIITGTQTFQAFTNLICANELPITIDNDANVEFIAGARIELHPGDFSTENGAEFIAWINDNIVPCTTPGALPALFNREGWVSKDNIIKRTVNDIAFFLYPNPSRDLITVGLLNNNFENVSFSIYDLKGNQIYNQSLPDVIDKEQARKIFNINTLPSGHYIVRLQIDNNNYLVGFIKE